MRPRIDALDGLRGIAIVLVVLSHGWQLWPVEWIDAHAWVRPVFRSGNTAVTVFLVAAGFLTYRTLAPTGDLTRMRPDVALLRRLVRVGPSLWLMLLVLAAAWSLDGTLGEDSTYENSASFLHVLTYTWNWYVQDNLVASRPEFGHLWYLSVDMQAFIVVAGLLYALRRRPVGLLWALSGFLLLLTWWRVHVSGYEFVFQVLVRTSARMDPFVAGVIAAVALSLLQPRVHDVLVPRLVVAATAVALPPLVWYCSVDERFLGLGVTLLELDLAVLFGAVGLGGGSPWPLRSRALQLLGRNSLLLYIWHYPVFVFVERHAADLSWPMKSALGLAATAVVTLLTYWLLERRITTLMRHPAWRRLDAGIPQAFIGLLRHTSDRLVRARR